MASIPDIHRKDCITILQLLTYSKRPLRFEELVDAIAIEVGSQPPFNPDNRMPEPMEITRLCSSLISTEHPVYGESCPQRFYAELAHFSVKEYITSSRVNEAFKDHLVERTARATIVEISLAYLSYVDTQSSQHLDRMSLWDLRHEEYLMELPNLSEDESTVRYNTHMFEDVPEYGIPQYIDHTFPFFSYSLGWVEHAQVAETSNAQLAESIAEFFSQRRLQYLWSCWPDESSFATRWYKVQSGREISPLYLPSKAGLIQSVRLLLKEGADPNGDGNYPPISGAYKGGHKEIVRLLLDHGAYIDARGDRSNPAVVFSALIEHDDDFVMELLDRGADPNSIGPYPDIPLLHGNECSVLHLAALLGHTNIVQYLLQKGADIDFQSNKEGTALSAAAQNGHMAVVQHLLDKGADINAEGGHYYDNPLAAACFGNHEAIARLLINKGANVRTRRKSDLDGLMHAAAKGNKGIVQDLVKRGILRYAMTDETLKRRYPLIIASRKGNKALVKSLLESGADVNAYPIMDRTALTEAAVWNHSELVELLLDNGANVNIRDLQGASALEHFFRSHPPENEESIPLLLIQNGADLGDQGQKDDFLICSCLNNYSNVVRLLLDNGSNAESTARVRSHLYLYQCDKNVVREFRLKTETEDQDEGSQYGSALHIASSRGFFDIAALLLDYGADPSRLDWHGWPATLIASRYGHTRIGRILSQGRSTEVNCEFSCLPPSRFTKGKFQTFAFSRIISLTYIYR